MFHETSEKATASTPTSPHRPPNACVWDTTADRCPRRILSPSPRIRHYVPTTSQKAALVPYCFSLSSSRLCYRIIELRWDLLTGDIERQRRNPRLAVSCSPFTILQFVTSHTQHHQPPLRTEADVYQKHSGSFQPQQPQCRFQRPREATRRSRPIPSRFWT